MAKDKQQINLKIAGKTYGMGINPEHEEYYRLAEKEINQYVAKFEASYTDGTLDVQDCLAFTALMEAVNRISLAQRRDLGEEVQRLKNLTDIIDQSLE